MHLCSLFAKIAKVIYKMKIIYKILTLTILCFCSSINILGQKKVEINGIVRESKTRKTLSFVNIYIKGKLIGTTTDFEGKFSLYITLNKKDTLAFSSIGYHDYYIPIKEIKHKRKIRVKLKPVVTELGEVIIHPTENPAHHILRKIKEKKKRNNPDKNHNIEYDRYDKNLIILKNLDKKFTNKKIFKNYKQLFIKEDNGMLSIPIYFSEKLTSNIEQGKPLLKKSQTLSENIKNISFLDIDEIKGYKEELTSQTNIYNNQLNIFGRSFISPIASTGLLYYKYYLIDSTKTDNNTLYKIRYKPKNSKDLVFKGSFIVKKNNWSIKEISANISSSANINFLNSLDLFYTYTDLDNSSTYYKQKNITAEFTYNKITDTTKINNCVLMQINASYGDISRLNKIIHNKTFNWENHYKNKDYTEINPVIIEDRTILEQRSSIVIDSLNNSWFIKASDKVYNTLLSGYIDIGKIGIGPYLELIKRNKLEGVRLNLGLRTNEKLSENYMLFGSIGYGVKDKKYKYSGSILYKFNGKKRITITFGYKKDIVRLSENGSIFKIKENMLTSAKDNIIAVFARRNSKEGLYREVSTNIHFSNEWNKNFTTNITLLNKTLSNTPYGMLKKDNIFDDLIINEIKIDNRISFHEKIMDKFVRRYYIGTNYPIFHFGFDFGHYNFNTKNGNYLRCRATVKQYVNIGLTKLKYIAEMGHMFGSVPFPLLEVHRSNQTRGYSRFSFNLMENSEYINSSFLTIMPELHLNGLIFNKIPLINTLNLREVISAKAAWGNLHKKHSNIMDINNNSIGLDNPYCEIGVGIENIFKYIRVEGVWRLTDKNKTNVHGFGLFFSLSFSL